MAKLLQRLVIGYTFLRKTFFMRKLILPVLLISLFSCSNPEDRATGNPDGTRFNSDENKVLNSKPGANDPDGKSDVERPDTSTMTSSSSNGTNSKTSGTNRSYGADSAHH